MKLQKSTLALLISAAALTFGVVVYETQYSDGPQAEDAESGERLFTFEETDVARLSLQREDTTLAFEQNLDNPDIEISWRMVEPEATLAEPAAVAYLLNILTTDPSLQTLTATPEQVAQYGLDEPDAVIELVLADETTHTVKVGGTDFSGDNRYVQVDEGETVYVVSGGLTNGIERPVAEWIAATDEPTSGGETADETAGDGAAPDGEDADATDAGAAQPAGEE
ncbi:MAG: DUF4340 domain-containing protein [Cyanobacteria bacterium J06632_22]